MRKAPVTVKVKQDQQADEYEDTESGEDMDIVSNWNNDVDNDPKKQIKHQRNATKKKGTNSTTQTTTRSDVTLKSGKGKVGKSVARGSHVTVNTNKTGPTKKKTTTINNSVDQNSIERSFASASMISLVMGDDDFDVEELTKEYSSNHSKIKIHVSTPFKNKQNGSIVVHVSMIAPRGKNQPFYLKDVLFKAMFQKTKNVYRLHGIASEKCDWIDNITKLGLRKNAHDEDGRYRRSTNSNVIDHLCFDAVYATGSTYDMIMADLKYIFEIYWQGVLSGKSQKIDIGSKVLTHTESLPGNLFNFLMEKKGGDNKNRSVAAKAITQEVKIYFADGAEWEENVLLDKFMVDADIKDFVIGRLGCHSWDDLSPAELGYVYFNYPNKEPPNWVSISREAF